MDKYAKGSENKREGVVIVVDEENMIKENLFFLF